MTDTALFSDTNHDNSILLCSNANYDDNNILLCSNYNVTTTMYSNTNHDDEKSLRSNTNHDDNTSLKRSSTRLRRRQANSCGNANSCTRPPAASTTY